MLLARSRSGPDPVENPFLVHREVAVNAFDVRIYAIRWRKNRRRPFEVRWHAAGRARSRSFSTRALADSYRAELIRAARSGSKFGQVTGEPACWAVPAPGRVSWLEHAASYAAVKWPHVSAHSWAGVADALATITPALTEDAAGRPPASVLRAALYGWAFNPGLFTCCAGISARPAAHDHASRGDAMCDRALVAEMAR